VSAREGGAAALRCVGEPVSWLALERLRLGELAPAERRAVEEHLAACAACAACLAEIDQPLRLPALPETARPATFRARLRAMLAGTARARLWAPAGATAVAGLVIWAGVFLFARPKPLDETLADGALPGIKGGGVALSLVRERDGAIDHDATRFTERDRWKALVTCPAARVVFWDVLVFDGASTTFPLASTAPITCGNRVPLPGAFRLDGTRPVQVCLLLAADPIDRTGVTARRLALDRRTTCAALQPER